MILQQFYKLLLADFSPTEWKESKAYLRANGFPPLRDTLKIKPSKLPERLSKSLERYAGPEERRRQLDSIISRLEEAVADLDDAIFASAKLSKKAERALEQLENIEDRLESAVSLMRKGDVVRREMESTHRMLPQPEGDLDIETEVSSRHRRQVESSIAELDELKKRLSADRRELSLARERFKQFLASSGRHLGQLVTLLPLIREITGPYVKFDSEELTDWEVTVAIRNFGKFRSRLPEEHSLLKTEEQDAVDALSHLAGNREAISDYNRIRKLQTRADELAAEVERKEEEVMRLEGPEEMEVIRSEVLRKAAENRHDYERLRNQLESIQNELSEVLGELGMTSTDSVTAALRSEVEGLIALLR